MANGRPLWFVGGVLATWTGFRVALLWPTAAPLTVMPTPAPQLPTSERAPIAPTGLLATTSATPKSTLQKVVSGSAVPEWRSRPASVSKDQQPVSIIPIAVAGADIVPSSAPRGTSLFGAAADRRQVITPPLPARPIVASRLRVDSWLVARPGGGDTLAFGQLGASQAGARIAYTLAKDRRVALSARLSAPLRGSGVEAGIGIDIQPTRLPIHLLVEQRIGIDGGGTRPAALILGGASVDLPKRFRLDAYAQGGAIARRGGFADGAAVVTRHLVTRGLTRLEAGAGSWGAAQRGVARLDVGPSIALVTPGAGGNLRLQLDYRARVAGRARPGSGPALTLGGSF